MPGNYPLRETNPSLLHLLVRQQPDERFIMEIDNVNPVPKWVAENTTKSRNELQPVLLCDFLSNLRQLRFVADDQSEVPSIGRRQLFYLRHCQELMFSHLKEGVSLAATVQF